MKFTDNKQKAMLAALAASLAVHAAAPAATVLAPAAGDLFLGFRAAGGQGASQSYLVNIGNDLTFRNAPLGTSFDVSIPGSIVTDLVATYGSGWNARGDLFWSIFGTRSSVNSTVYASREQDPVGSPASPWSALTSTARNGTSSQITSVIEGVGGFTGSEATANSPVAILQTNSVTASSYQNQVAAAGTTDFGSLSQWISIEGDFGNGTSGTALDVFRIASTGVTQVGTFTLNNSGTLRFAAPVPEPAAAGLLALGITSVLARRRRVLTNNP